MAQTPAANTAKQAMKGVVPPVPSAPVTTPASASASSVSTIASKTLPTPMQAPTPDESLTLALKNLGAQHSPRGEVLRLPDVSFAPGHAQFKEGGGTDMKQVVALLGKYPNALLIIDGYSDNRGSQQLNDRLSLERAKSVEQALVTDGLKAARIRTRGVGAADPIADNGTRDGRAKNRRVELVFSNTAGTFASASDQITAG